MSARWSTGWARACSGAMYSTVPTTEPTTVCCSDSSSRRCSSADGAPDGELRAGRRSRNPEVHDQRLAGLGIMMLAGFRSRWTTPASCAAASPDATWRAIGATRVGQLSLRLEDRRQIVPLEVRHRDVLDAVHLSHVVDADDVPVRDFPGEQQFLFEPPLEGACRLRIGGNLRAHRLERDCDPQILVERFVDRPHAAGTEKPQDAVPASEELPTRSFADAPGADAPAVCDRVPVSRVRPGSESSAR